MSYQQSNCECEECGHEIDDGDYIYCENCRSTEPAKCEKCDLEIEDPHESVVYCEDCWGKYTQPLSEQLKESIEEIEKFIVGFNSEIKRVQDHREGIDKNLDAIYSRMGKMLESFEKLSNAIKNPTGTQETPVAIEEPKVE